MNGIDFVALQVTDIEDAAEFFERHLGWPRVESPPQAIVFGTDPIPVAVREPFEDLDAVPHPGIGTALWIRVPDTDDLAERLAADGVEITAPPHDGPFGTTMTFVGPGGHHLTAHDGGQGS